MLWFIFDDEKSTAVFVDGTRVYAVTDVIKAKESLNSNDNEEQEEDEGDTLSSSFETQLISKRMIDQFFHEVEGPDRDWEQF